MSTALINQARRATRDAAEASEQAARHRATRDHAVRQLRAEDPQRWSYTAIADATGLGPELVAAIIQGRRPRSKTR